MEASQPINLAAVMEGQTRFSVPHKTHGEVMEELESLGTALKSAFAKLAKAQDQLAELGVTVSVELPPPLSQAWKEYQASYALETDLANKR